VVLILASIRARYVARNENYVQVCASCASRITGLGAHGTPARARGAQGSPQATEGARSFGCASVTLLPAVEFQSVSLYEVCCKNGSKISIFCVSWPDERAKLVKGNDTRQRASSGSGVPDGHASAWQAD
jgi:hypothetical protein